MIPLLRSIHSTENTLNSCSFANILQCKHLNFFFNCACRLTLKAKKKRSATRSKYTFYLDNHYLKQIPINRMQTHFKEPGQHQNYTWILNTNLSCNKSKMLLESKVGKLQCVKTSVF